MFVMKFGAGNQNPYVPPTIPNEAITFQNGFPGQGMPNLWLLNANEGELRWVDHPLGDIPGKIVNFLHGFAHFRDVYAAVVVPSRDDEPELAWALGPIWDGYRWVQRDGNWELVRDLPLAPVIEVDVDTVERWGQIWGFDKVASLTMVIGHELGHTVLWDFDNDPNVDNDQSFGGDRGHHIIGRDGRVGQHTIDCLMWPYFPPRICPSGYALCSPRANYCPDRFLHWEWNDMMRDWIPREVNNWVVIRPSEFCQVNPGCQSLWKLNP
ncbi:MAG: hypothetical protein RMK94_00735 [Armatimonadota bacterium]|nr:hypothetical protein [Armatimonadota bacterium]